MQHYNTHTTPQYIIRTNSRKRTDPAVSIRDARVRTPAIQWRSNTWSINRHCTHCHRPFHRTHISPLTPCDLYDDLTKLIPDSQHRAKFERMKATLPPRIQPGFTPLDYYLNINDIPNFELAIDHISQHTEQQRTQSLLKKRSPSPLPLREGKRRFPP